jgi:hypothetical protein
LVQHFDRVHKVTLPAVQVHAVEADAAQQEVEAVKIW